MTDLPNNVEPVAEPKNELPTPPAILVTDSTVQEQVGAALRFLALLAAAVPTLTALFGKRDLIGLINYISSAEFAPVLGVLVTAGVLGWSQVSARINKQKLITAADHAPDAVAQVVRNK